MAQQQTDNRIVAVVMLARHAFGHYKWQIATLTGLGFLSGILEGIGINALIPLFSFISGQKSETTDLITNYIGKFFYFLGVPFSLKYLLIFIVLLFLLKTFIAIVFSYIRITIDTNYEETTRNKLFKSVLAARWSYLLQQKMGYLDTMLMTDVLRGSILLRQIGNIIMVLTGLMMYILVAINISPIITLITLVLGGFLFLSFKPFLRRIKVYAARTSAANKEVAHYVNENILGMKTIKAMHIHKKIVNRGGEFFLEFKKLKKATFILSSLSSALLQPASLILVAAVFAVAYKMPNFNFAVLVAVVYLIQRIFQYIQQFQSNLQEAIEATPYLQNLLNYQAQAERNQEQDTGSGSYKFQHTLAFKNVGFFYQVDRPVLKDVSFTIKKGEMVGLIGESGSGKTTIVDLLLRLFTIGQGEILLDNKNIKNISLTEWRKNIGYVSQDIFLLNDTIANNIRFFDPSLTDDDLVNAAQMANIYEFVKTSPQGFETVVGERGIMLSAGQRQRIAIARILARQPQLLILDEATSALDNESEAKIQEVIENLRHKITVLVVAHRLSTVMNADKLIVLEKGKIIEAGTPKNLLADKNSYFYKLSNVRAQ